MAWSPNANLLAWTTRGGTLYRWTDVIPSSSPSPVTAVASATTTRPVQRSRVPDLFGIDDVEDTAAPAEPNVDDVDIDDQFLDDNWVIDDLGDGMADGGGDEERGRGGFVREMGMSYCPAAFSSLRRFFVVSVTKAQPAFQPGSTPMENKKRYLSQYNAKSWSSCTIAENYVHLLQPTI